MTAFGYCNCYQKPKKKKKTPKTNGNVTDSGMTALTDEPLPC